MSAHEAEHRLVDLEVRLTHLEDTLDHLTRYQLQQEKLIGELTGQLDQLKALLRDLQPGAVGRREDEPPPPHY